MSRLEKFNVLDKYFSGNCDFDINEYIDNAWQIESDDRVYNVKLRFSAKIADEAAGIKWHKTQFTTKNSDGSIIMEFLVNSLDEIACWILSYGNNVKVISPKVLRKKIINTANNIADLYAAEKLQLG
jgi:predicted DNA-binding transcriptional regulator YafY